MLETEKLYINAGETLTKRRQMTDKHKQLFYQIIQPIKNHIGVAMIALVYGMTAYGLIYVLLRLVRYVETL